MITASCKITEAQVNGTNIMEYQFGNIPDADPEDLSTIYNQTNIQYRQNQLRAFARIEQFYSTDSIKRDYVSLSQFQLKYSFKKIELKVGNFYETLGRELLLRSFEIPSSIQEDRIYRVRQGFYRDIQGVSVNYSGEKFRFKIVRGKPLYNLIPPGEEDRRTELIEGIQPEYSFWDQNIGIVAMRHNQNGTNTTYGSIFIEGNLPLNFSYYGEYARNFSQNAEIFNYSSESSYGAYLSLNYNLKGFGGSFELKKYQDLFIGSGISDPPTLVKEHSYRLLNRSTHVTELFNESGYQVELYYTFSDGKRINLNNSKATNKIIKEVNFNEIFLEYYWPFNNGDNIKSYFDFSRDELKLEVQRYAGGLYYTHIIKGPWSLAIENEVQIINRSYYPGNPITNFYGGLSLNKSTKLSASLYYEFTTDLIVSNKPDTEKTETERYFYGVGFTYRPNFRNTIILFAGERRGGPACISGICYEVLDFSGLEIRWTLKF